MVLPFALVVPGYAWIRAARVAEPPLDIAAGILVSVAFITLLAMGLLYLHLWSPGIVLIGLVVLTTAGVAVDGRRARS